MSLELARSIVKRHPCRNSMTSLWASYTKIQPNNTNLNGNRKQNKNINLAQKKSE